MFTTRENASIPKLREAKVAEKLAMAKFSECGECDKCGKNVGGIAASTRQAVKEV